MSAQVFTDDELLESEEALLRVDITCGPCFGGGRVASGSQDRFG
jgi:hypothetical protein